MARRFVLDIDTITDIGSPRSNIYYYNGTYYVCTNTGFYSIDVDNNVVTLVNSRIFNNACIYERLGSLRVAYITTTLQADTVTVFNCYECTLNGDNIFTDELLVHSDGTWSSTEDRIPSTLNRSKLRYDSDSKMLMGFATNNMAGQFSKSWILKYNFEFGVSNLSENSGPSPYSDYGTVGKGFYIEDGKLNYVETTWDSLLADIIRNNPVVVAENVEYNSMDWFVVEDELFVQFNDNTCTYNPTTNELSPVLSTPIFEYPSAIDDKIYSVNDDNFYEIRYSETSIDYTFYTDDGNPVVQLTDKLPAGAIVLTLSYTDNRTNISAELFYVGGTRETVNYSLPNPEGYRITALSRQNHPREDNITEGLNLVSITDNASFYPVYQRYKPLEDTFEVKLYKNSAERNRVDKTNYLTEVSSMWGVMREESSLIDMVITFKQTAIPTFNYVYIPSLKRYYFVNDITTIRKGLWQVSLSVDPLMTYKNAILNCKGFIDRNANEFNPHIIDKRRVIEQGREIIVDEIRNKLFRDMDVTPTGSFVISGIHLRAEAE